MVSGQNSELVSQLRCSLPALGAEFYSHLGFSHFRHFFLLFLFVDLFVPLDREICRKKTLGVTCNLLEP